MPNDDHSSKQASTNTAESTEKRLLPYQITWSELTASVAQASGMSLEDTQTYILRAFFSRYEHYCIVSEGDRQTIMIAVFGADPERGFNRVSENDLQVALSRTRWLVDKLLDSASSLAEREAFQGALLEVLSKSRDMAAEQPAPRRRGGSSPGDALLAAMVDVGQRLHEYGPPSKQADLEAYIIERAEAHGGEVKERRARDCAVLALRAFEGWADPGEW